MKTMKMLLATLILAIASVSFVACDEGSEEEEICCACRCTGTGPNLALCSKMENVPLGESDDCRVACAQGPCSGICLVLTAAEADCE